MFVRGLQLYSVLVPSVVQYIVQRDLVKANHSELMKLPPQASFLVLCKLAQIVLCTCKS